MPGSRPDPEGPDGLTPEDAFALLGNETRVGILQALWDAFESGRGGNAVPYSRLFERAPIGDSGNFSYHLEKLTGPFVRKTGEGYELTQSGINVVRSVLAGTVTADTAVGPEAVDAACPLCGAPVEFVYADEFMNVTCTSCPGRSRWHGEPGHLFGALVPPLGVDQHAVEDAFRAAVTYSLYEISIMHAGVCPHCLGPVEATVDACADHDAGGSHCPSCDRHNLADVWMACATCKRSIPPPVTVVALDHPAVTAFYVDNGVDHRFATWETVARSVRVGEELLAGDPFRLRVTIPAGDAELRLTFDEELNVLDVAR